LPRDELLFFAERMDVRISSYWKPWLVLKELQASGLIEIVAYQGAKPPIRYL